MARLPAVETSTPLRASSLLAAALPGSLSEAAELLPGTELVGLFEALVVRSLFVRVAFDMWSWQGVRILDQELHSTDLRRIGLPSIFSISRVAFSQMSAGRRLS